MPAEGGQATSSAATGAKRTFYTDVHWKGNAARARKFVKSQRTTRPPQAIFTLLFRVSLPAGRIVTAEIRSEHFWDLRHPKLELGYPLVGRATMDYCVQAYSHFER